MTINREALNCITNGGPLALHNKQRSVDDSYRPRSKAPLEFDELQLLDKRFGASVDVTEESTYQTEFCSDDESSVSSFSISSTRSRQVTFRENLVTEVNYRLRTPLREIRKLYYSYEETQKFRQEYRQERKRVAEEAETSSRLASQDGTSSDSSFPIWKHKISRVVIKRGDVLETFVDRDLNRFLDLGLSRDSSATNGSSASSTSGTTTHSATVNCKMADDDFFDNDNFWSGQITWY